MNLSEPPATILADGVYRCGIHSNERPELFVRNEACEALTFFDPFGLYNVSVIRVSSKCSS